MATDVCFEKDSPHCGNAGVLAFFERGGCCNFFSLWLLFKPKLGVVNKTFRGLEVKP